jgi:hypothetical protein
MPPVPQGTFTLWLEERKLPPLDEATLAKAATFVPMLSAEWQMQNDPENGKSPSDGDKFQYDGKFIANSKVTGAWTTVAQVNAVGDFDPQAKPNPGRSPLKKIIFQDQGATDSPSRIWSGDTLMDLERNEALKITAESINGSDYLFIECGGFGPKNPAGWQCPLMVLKRD